MCFGQMISRVSVEETLVSDNFGGCMARLNVNIRQETGLDCAGDYVTFSCTGTHIRKDLAYLMFDQANMAMVLGLKVNIKVDESRKHGGFCFANRLDVIK